ncbi:MAG: transposase [Alistipes sp.]|jgi:hypothetical protein|nr:transposase [Alistipes sp.]
MGKGRNRDLIYRRDEKLLLRYYYWTEVERLRFDDALRVLSEKEFFLSEERILKIIREKYDSFVPEQYLAVARRPRPVTAQLSLFKGE